jgi:hypothetical protein
MMVDNFSKQRPADIPRLISEASELVPTFSPRAAGAARAPRPAPFLETFGWWPLERNVLVPRAAKTLARAATCAALLFLLLWPALYNGQPLFSADTSAYIRGFDAGIVWLSGKTSAWTTWASQLASPPEVANRSVAEELSTFQSPTFVIAGRSVSYGALLYLGELLGGLWASIAFQAAAALAALGLTLRHLKLFSWTKFAFIVAALALGSSLPFFTSFLLPDIFAGLALLAAANMLALGDRLTRWEQVFWLSILAAAVVFHPSHVAIVMALLAVAITARFFTKRICRAGIFALSVAAGIGFAAEIVFALLVQNLGGVSINRPPVIMARMIADGPGASYLHNQCPRAGLVACEFVDRLLSNSDAFLWDTSPETGIYFPATVEKRRALGNEQYRFAAAVLAYDPGGQIAAWLKDAFQQLKMVGLSDFLSAAEEAFPKLPRVYSERMAQSPIWKKELPVDTYSTVTIFVIMLALMFVCVTLIRHWQHVSVEQRIFCAVIFLGELSNAVVCGALSGPHERYQARLTWLIPLVALLLHYGRRRSQATALRS